MTGDRAGARDVSARTKGQAGKLPIAPVTGTERRPRRSRDVLKVNPGSGTPSDRDCSLGQMERSREEDKKRNETGGKRTEEVGHLCPVPKSTEPKISTIKALK